MRQCHGWETEAQPWGVCSRGLTKSKSPRWGSLEGAEVLGDCCARPWFVTWPNAVAVPCAAGVSPDGTRPPWAECCRSQERHLLTCESPRLREGGCAAPCDPISRRFFFFPDQIPQAQGEDPFNFRLFQGCTWLISTTEVCLECSKMAYLAAGAEQAFWSR